MRKVYFVLTACILIFMGTLLAIFAYPKFALKSNDGEQKDSKTANVVYSESYEAKLRDDVIYELYGSREQYATDHTSSRADYVDKEASKSGKLVIDEKRMQEVYNSKLKEFDAKR